MSDKLIARATELLLCDDVLAIYLETAEALGPYVPIYVYRDAYRALERGGLAKKSSVMPNSFGLTYKGKALLSAIHAVRKGEVDDHLHGDVEDGVRRKEPAQGGRACR